jgi:CDP-diacylglycerol--glycerol-3-phosphate 3-phosphatidyltransferase
MLATLITLSRFPLLALVVGSLYWGPSAVRMSGVGLLIAGLLLDTVDGVVARRRQETSLMGSVLDIAADRTYELVLWFCFAELDLIPMLIPLLVVARTALTDAIRSIGVGQGIAPFAQTGTRIEHFLVASSWMRSGYGLSKALAFGTLALAHAVGAEDKVGDLEWLTPTGQALAWVTVVLCLLRGVPVIVGGFRPHLGAGMHDQTEGTART